MTAEPGSESFLARSVKADADCPNNPLLAYTWASRPQTISVVKLSSVAMEQFVSGELGSRDRA